MPAETPLYYGNPETLKRMIVSIKSMTGINVSDYDQQISDFDELIRPEIEGDLAGCFKEWPDPLSTNINVISTLWNYKMAAMIIFCKGQSSKPGAISKIADQWEEKYKLVLNNIKSGRTIVVGAVTIQGALPGFGGGSPRRTQYPAQDYLNAPRDLADLRQEGLRLNNR